MWRLYIEGKAQLWELQQTYSVDDMVKANLCLDIQKEMEKVLMPKVKESQ